MVILLAWWPLEQLGNTFATTSETHLELLEAPIPNLWIRSGTALLSSSSSQSRPALVKISPARRADKRNLIYFTWLARYKLLSRLEKLERPEKRREDSGEKTVERWRRRFAGGVHRLKIGWKRIWVCHRTSNHT